MDNQTKEILGAWIQAIGTVTSAIGSTPSKVLSTDFLNALDLWGNVLQASGNALQADAEEEITFGKIGNEIQSIGNSTVVAGILLNVEEETKQRLVITGNWLQALGGVTALGDDLQGSSSPGQLYNFNGNLLQSIGNSLQALSGVYELKKVDQIYTYSNELKDSQSLKVSGSWIQAVGSVLSLIGTLKEEVEDTQPLEDYLTKTPQKKVSNT